MQRDYTREIDDLKIQLEELKTLVKGILPVKPQEQAEHMELIPQSVRDRCPNAIKLSQYAKEHNLCGALYYYGSYSSGEREYWREPEEIVSVDKLLGIDNDKVAQVLSSLGNKQRLAILKELMKEPLTVNELIERLNLGTTGQVYHHLKALQASDFISTGERGKYEFRPHRLHSFILLLAGVQDGIDEKYSKGSWEEIKEE